MTPRVGRTRLGATVALLLGVLWGCEDGAHDDRGAAKDAGEVDMSERDDGATGGSSTDQRHELTEDAEEQTEDDGNSIDDDSASDATNESPTGVDVSPAEDTETDELTPTGQTDEPAPSTPQTDPDQPTACAVQTVTLARSGLTSSCGFEMPEVSIDTFFANVVIQPRPGDRRVVCRVGGSGSCADSRGWFTSGNEVALCDETCGQFHDYYPQGALILELGCQTTFCRDRCGQLTEGCGPASDCCPGMSCGDDDTCAACTATGDACDQDTAAMCCSGTCDAGRCCYDFGAPCARTSDCCAGECIEASCGCPEPTLLCGGECVDVTASDEHCGACDVACADGASCEESACVCEPDTPTMLYCDGGCVDGTVDIDHCGGCDTPCRDDQACVGGSCECAPGLVECEGLCVDPESDWSHCGGCGGQCASVEVCEAGSCVCRPDRLLCEGACIDPMTDNFNCGECGRQCNGQRRCSGGECQ